MEVVEGSEPHCVNCSEPFPDKSKGYIRHSINTTVRGTKTTVGEALSTFLFNPVTPCDKRKGAQSNLIGNRCLCGPCFKVISKLVLAQIACSKHEDEFRSRTVEYSYVKEKERTYATPGKRKHSERTPIKTPRSVKVDKA